MKTGFAPERASRDAGQHDKRVLSPVAAQFGARRGCLVLVGQRAEVKCATELVLA